MLRKLDIWLFCRINQLPGWKPSDVKLALYRDLTTLFGYNADTPDEKKRFPEMEVRCLRIRNRTMVQIGRGTLLRIRDKLNMAVAQDFMYGCLQKWNQVKPRHLRGSKRHRSGIPSGRGA